MNKQRERLSKMSLAELNKLGAKTVEEYFTTKDPKRRHALKRLLLDITTASYDKLMEERQWG